MREKYKAIIEISMLSPNLADNVYLSLKPESESKVRITLENNIVILHLQVNTIATMRALLNSYLRWIATIENTIKVAADHLSEMGKLKNIK